jgi:hypothetical protein
MTAVLSIASALSIQLVGIKGAVFKPISRLTRQKVGNNRRLGFYHGLIRPAASLGAGIQAVEGRAFPRGAIGIGRKGEFGSPILS